MPPPNNWLRASCAEVVFYFVTVRTGDSFMRKFSLYLARDIFVGAAFCALWSGAAYAVVLALRNFLPAGALHPVWGQRAAVLWVCWPWVVLTSSLVLTVVSALPGLGSLMSFRVARSLPNLLQDLTSTVAVLALGVCCWIAVMPTHEPLVGKGFKAANRIPGVSTVMGLFEAKADEKSGGADASTPAASAPAETTPPKEEKKVTAWRMK
jgi:hypothetical protein